MDKISYNVHKYVINFIFYFLLKKTGKYYRRVDLNKHDFFIILETACYILHYWWFDVSIYFENVITNDRENQINKQSFDTIFFLILEVFHNTNVQFQMKIHIISQSTSKLAEIHVKQITLVANFIQLFDMPSSQFLHIKHILKELLQWLTYYFGLV